jgi:hypothetical protein
MLKNAALTRITGVLRDSWHGNRAHAGTVAILLYRLDRMESAGVI